LGRSSPVAAILLTACALACGGEPDPAGHQQRLRIAVIPKATSHEFWQSVQAGALKGGHDADVEVLWKGPAREDDRDEQIKVVEGFLSRGIDAIVIAPLDKTALIAPLRDAKAEGIPVVIIDSGIEWEGYDSFAATNNQLGGQLAAMTLGEVLGGRGKVLMMRYLEGSASTTNREEGFLETLMRDFPDIEIVSSDQYGGATVESCQRTAEDLLNRYTEIDGIFVPNESSTVAFVNALASLDRPSHTRLVGFDASEPLVDGLRSGAIYALIVQNPMAMGEIGVETAAALLRGGTVEKLIDTGVQVVTAANMDEPAIHSLLSPPLQDWLP
jgi:ribose transport system substrate-binding protein